MSKSVVAGLVGSALVLSGCATQWHGSADGPKVVFTTNILGSALSPVVTCAGGRSTVLMPAGSDPHHYSPSSSGVVAMVKSTMVVSNGLELEQGLRTALKTARSMDVPVMEVASEVKPIRFAEPGAAGPAHADHPGHVDGDHPSPTPTPTATVTPSPTPSATVTAPQEPGHDDHDHEPGKHDDHDHETAPTATPQPTLTPQPTATQEAGHEGHDHGPGEHGKEEAGHEGHGHGPGEHGKEEAGHEGHDHGPGEHGEEEAGHEGHNHGLYDPHFWQDPGRMALAADKLGEELANKTGNPEFRECGEKVAAELHATDEKVRGLLWSVPERERQLFTDHDAFGYLAAAYGYKIAGVLMGQASGAAPSSRQLSDIVSHISTSDVDAVFSNSALSQAVIEAVAKEVGRGIPVVALHVDSVGAPGSPAQDYHGMVVENAKAIAGALGGNPEAAPVKKPGKTPDHDDHDHGESTPTPSATLTPTPSPSAVPPADDHDHDHGDGDHAP